MTLLKAQSPQFASFGYGSGSGAQQGVLSGNLDVYTGVVETESEFRMKMTDGEGEVGSERMRGIVGNVEMCILDSNGHEVAGTLAK